MQLFRSNIYENLRMGLDTLWQHKLRSLLTILGVVIGIAAVITMVSIGQGASELVRLQFQNLGSKIGRAHV